MIEVVTIEIFTPVEKLQYNSIDDECVISVMDNSILIKFRNNSKQFVGLPFIVTKVRIPTKPND